MGISVTWSFRIQADSARSIDHSGSNGVDNFPGRYRRPGSVDTGVAKKLRVIVATGLNSGAAEYKNMGDVSMLQAAVARLLSFLPDAHIEVLTDSPSNLARYCPGARPLSRAGCAYWLGDRILLGRYHRFLPKWASTRLSDFKRALRLGCPSLLEFLIRLRLSFRDGDGRRRDVEDFLAALKKSDLLVVCGSGGFADSCREWNLSTLDTIEVALRRGIPVVMFGQGMGPLNDKAVLRRAKDVLPGVSLITLRGSRGGLSLLELLGVPSAGVLTTGDEAVELAYQGRTQGRGSAVGVNLRVASYSEVQADILEEVRTVLQEFARRHNAPLLPIPIAFHEYANDHRTIRRLLAGFDDESDGGLSLDTPLSLIQQTARCRIIVTGAYHAAVFALAQGIPVVCLSNSAYYLAKFQGLEDLFGHGCAIVMLGEPDLPERLAVAIESTWNSAEVVRSPLLQSALRQVEASREAYGRMQILIGSEANQAQLVMSEGA
jgi:polysaccharide pyruvyl transferase WcaK-like protein